MGTCEYGKIDYGYEGFLTEKYWSKNRPISIHFELTQKCNLRCIHCLFTHEVRDELSTNEVFDVLRQLEKAGIFNLSLSGGEVFTRGDIKKILDFLRIHRFMLTLFTNGTLLNSALIEKIAAAKAKSVEISVYGATGDVHDAITQMPGSFQKTIGNIRELLSANVSVLFKGFLLKTNFHQRWQMIELANKLGVLHTFDFNLIPMVTGYIGNLSAGLTIEQIKRIYQEVDMGGLVLRNHLRIKEKGNQLPKGGSVLCNAGRIYGCIGSNGDVFPCPILRLRVGNLREKSFSEIWRTNKIDSIRYMTLGDLKECPDCPALKFCNRCPGVAYLETGDYLGPAPFSVCNKYKALAREERR
jgi:radical SAM protein with 4Fe4S-binding SPASM domain